MLGCSVEIGTKNSLYLFIEGQTHFGKPKRFSNEFDPVCTKIGWGSNLNTPSEQAPQVERYY